MPKRTFYPEPLLTPSEVAALFRVSRETVNRWANRNPKKLTVVRTPSGHRRYTESQVRTLLKSGKFIRNSTKS